MDTCEAFLNAYRDLEEVLCARYGQKFGTVQIYAAEEGAKYAEELSLFREMRNLLSHHGRIGGEHPVLPSEASLNKLLEILEYAKNPPVAKSLATPRESLCCVSLSGDLKKTVDIMERRGYSHIPVLREGGGLFGVFSVGTLFAFAKANPTRSIEGLKIEDLSDFLPPDKHTTEKFAFAKEESTLHDIKELFKLTGPYHRRVVAVFVTSDGTGAGKLLGMITPWDVFKADER
ncbi:MAG: CBS domain-containing protein [Clostridia bacterium]|nr:CBS domain-containing protein [Clostridia bacterium]